MRNNTEINRIQIEGNHAYKSQKYKYAKIFEYCQRVKEYDFNNSHTYLMNTDDIAIPKKKCRFIENILSGRYSGIRFVREIEYRMQIKWLKSISLLKHF